jgi:hypothetical protein
MKKLPKITDERAESIRVKMYRLVDNQILSHHCTSLFDFHQRSMNGSLFDEPLCTFVNRLCPDDLCYLPYGHIGSRQGYHITGTVSYEYAVRWEDGLNMMPAGASRSDLIRMGSRLAFQDEVADNMGIEYRELTDAEEAAEEATWD